MRRLLKSLLETFGSERPQEAPDVTLIVWKCDAALETTFNLFDIFTN